MTKNRFIRVLRIDENGAEVIDIENTNQAFEEALGWDDAWNTPTIRVNGHSYIAVCSDTGKIRHEPIACIGANNLFEPNEQGYIKEPFIVGTTIITKFDGIDDFCSLDQADLNRLADNLMPMHKATNQWYPKVLIIE